MSDALRPERREALTELAVSAGFVAAVAAMFLALPPAVAPAWPTALWLLAICVVLLRIEFEVGEGCSRPVVLVLVPMLVLLPAQFVPLVVVGAYLVSGVLDVARRRGRPGRVVLLSLANSWFAVGPALVIALTGVPDSLSVTAIAIVVAAVAAEVGVDFAVTAVRLRVGLGVDIRTELPLFGWVYLVDVLLTPIGMLAAAASVEQPLAAGAVLPLAALLVVFARERRGRIENALELHRQASEEEARLQSIVQNSSDVIAILESDGGIRTLTGSVAPLLGPDWRDAVGSSLLERAHAEDRDLLAAFLAGVAGTTAGESHELEWRIRRADGSYRHVETVATNLLGDPRLNGIVLTARDVDERKAFEEQLRHRAFHDPLTQLANRALFYDRVEHALAHDERDDRLVAVLFVDLDDFKQLNDRLGHAAGDELLVEVARRMQHSIRAVDTAARLGGDEFGILVESVSGAGEAVQVGERILAAFAEPLELTGEEVRVSASLGIAISGPGDRGVDELLRKADLAMYAAKRNPERRWEMYEAALDHVQTADAVEAGRGTWYQRADEQRQEIVDCLRRDDAIEVVYQPIIDLRTGLIAGYEALSRFADPLRRPPNVWFAQAHRHGLGYELEAKAVAAALVANDRPAGTYLTLNLSPSALVSNEVQAVLPKRLDGLVIEITENEVASGEPALLTAIAAVRARGGRLAVDDAGSGYAGLKHVMRLAPDLIKLDRALIDGVHADPAKAALIESFVRYAHKIDAAVCGEGVETIEDLTRLAELDVAYGQGYGIARPGRPWQEVAGEAAVACADAYAQSLDDATSAAERMLDAVTQLLANASGRDDVVAAMPSLAEQLAAEAVAIRVRDDVGRLADLDGPASPVSHEPFELPGASQVLAGDIAADPSLRARLIDTGYPSMLALPLRCGGTEIGLLEVYRADERPWSRDHVRQARIIGHLLAGTLERMQRQSAPV